MSLDDVRYPGGVSSRVITVPNVLSALRLLGVPAFLWLVFTHHNTSAVIVLAASGATDYLDGKIARHYRVVSKLGTVLDPLADRLYIVSTLVGLVYREALPWWIAAALVVRELFLAATLPVLHRHGRITLPVHFVGKVATFSLLLAFPLLLLGIGSTPVAEPARIVGWALCWWGTALYWVAGVIYGIQTRQVLRFDRLHPRARPQEAR